MKEFGEFFGGLVRDLSGLRESAVQGLTSLQAEHDRLADQIRRAQERHETVRPRRRILLCVRFSVNCCIASSFVYFQGMKRTIQCLQDQFSLLLMEAQKDYTDLHSTSKALQEPLHSVQEQISR